MAEVSREPTPWRWERVKILSGALGTVIVPVVIAIVGNQYTRAIKDGETQVRLVELAIKVLSDSTTAGRGGLHLWAEEVIDICAPAKLSDAAREDLRRGQLATIAAESRKAAAGFYDLAESLENLPPGTVISGSEIRIPLRKTPKTRK